MQTEGNNKEQKSMELKTETVKKVNEKKVLVL